MFSWVSVWSKSDQIAVALLLRALIISGVELWFGKSPLKN
jgi:hypothetical protein